MIKSHQNSLFCCLLIWQANVEMSHLKRCVALGTTLKAGQQQPARPQREGTVGPLACLCRPLVVSVETASTVANPTYFNQKHLILENMCIYIPTCENSFSGSPIFNITLQR